VTEYGVIYERANDGSWWARAADLPVYSVGDSREEAEREIRSAIALYLNALAQAGMPVPDSRSVVGVVTV
jgi:predicted RNase H-like HicB family nuclease